MSAQSFQTSETEEGQSSFLSRHIDGSGYSSRFSDSDEELPNIQFSNSYASEFCYKTMGSQEEALESSSAARGHAEGSASSSSAMTGCQDRFTSMSSYVQPFYEVDPELIKVHSNSNVQISHEMDSELREEQSNVQPLYKMDPKLPKFHSNSNDQPSHEMDSDLQEEQSNDQPLHKMDPKLLKVHSHSNVQLFHEMDSELQEEQSNVQPLYELPKVHSNAQPSHEANSDLPDEQLNGHPFYGVDSESSQEQSTVQLPQVMDVQLGVFTHEKNNVRIESAEDIDIASNNLLESETDVEMEKNGNFTEALSNDLPDNSTILDCSSSSVTQLSILNSKIMTETAISLRDVSGMKLEIHEEVKKEFGSFEIDFENVPRNTCETDSIMVSTCITSTVSSKLEISSEDEEIYCDPNSAKSGGESSSSKGESPSGPSCSSTSRASQGINSLSSDSENGLPSINLTLPIKKRKRESPTEVVCHSSSDEESGDVSDIDYSNLTPEEIKGLIEEAKRFGSIKRKCKCPKKKWSELPVKGPIKSSGKCTIGKGDWSESMSQPCPDCAAGICRETHKRPGRRGRRRNAQPRIVPSKFRPRGTVGQDVPIIDLSDSEEISPIPTTVPSEVTVSAVPAAPVKECIVLSSSEDDDDIVCEAVIKTNEKNQPTSSDASHSEVAPKGRSPDVVLIQSTSQAQPHVPLIPLASDSEIWPDLNIDLGNFDETINLLANIVGPPSIQMESGPLLNTIAHVPERPPSPEGWSCPICLEPKTAVNEIMSTTCGHVFCGNCIRSAVRIHKKCPTCRKKLTAKQFHKIFL